MFASILPSRVCVVCAEEWMWSTPVTPEEEACVQRAVDKRKREFRAARHAARHALLEMGIDHHPLLAGKGREPQWPQGIIGSITHTGNFCAVAVARADDVQGVGIDAEQNDALKDDIREMICTPAEQQWARAQEGEGRTWASKLIFSAKESIHKVYYPLNAHTLDFLDAELVVDVASSTFEARIINPFARAVVPVFRLHGRFAVDAHHVYTAILLDHGTLQTHDAA